MTWGHRNVVCTDVLWQTVFLFHTFLFHTVDKDVDKDTALICAVGQSSIKIQEINTQH